LEHRVPLIENGGERLPMWVLLANAHHRVERIGFPEPDQRITNEARPFLETAERAGLLWQTSNLDDPLDRAVVETTRDQPVNDKKEILGSVSARRLRDAVA
jgi:hypothetical protein